MKAILLLLLTITHVVHGQTDKRMVIAGTKCSIIPPAGFVPATGFTGLQNASTGSSIMVLEIPVPAQQTEASFTADLLKTRGMTLIDKSVIDFNNAKATFIKLSQQANGTLYLKQVLVFGDSRKTVMVNGIYPEANKSLEDEIRKSVLSALYNENQKDDPLAAVAFMVNVTGTEFKFAKSIGGSLVYSIDGQVPTQTPTVTVVNSLARVLPADTKAFSLNRLKQLPRGELSEVKEINPLQIDNLKGYEIVANGKNKDAKDQLIYQAMLFDEGGGYYMIVGLSTEDYDRYLGSFRKITKTFKKK